MNHEHDAALAALRNLYARQAHLIDAGQHEQWAQTFTPDGQFHSPTYGQPAVGHDKLADISKAFEASAKKNDECHRHLIDNIWVVDCDGTRAQVRAYLSILATRREGGEVRILRIVTINDKLEKSSDGWRVRHRTVTY